MDQPPQMQPLLLLDNRSVGFHLLYEEIVFNILDKLEENPSDVKSFSAVCKSFYAIESRHRKFLKPWSEEHLTRILSRYTHISELDLSLIESITDASLGAVSNLCKETLKSIRFFKPGKNSASFSNVNVDYHRRSWVKVEQLESWVKDSTVIAVSEFKNLERLRLSKCKSITDVGITRVAEGCSKLRFLSLKWCTGVSDLGVGLIALKCKELRSLNLSYLKITKNCLPQILELQYLEDLVLKWCPIDEDSIAAPKLGCKSLKTLDMSGTKNVGHVVWSSLIRDNGIPKLLILSFSSCTDLLQSDSLQSLSTLQCINLHGCKVTRSGLNAIGNWCCSLKELNLSACNEVTDEALSQIFTKHKDLQKLDVSLCNEITCVSIVHLTSSCASLVSLKMAGCTEVSAEAFVAIGQHCQFLEELDVSRDYIDNEGLISLSRCPRLSSIKLEDCVHINNEGFIEHIATSYPKLKEINLCGCRVMITGILAIIRGCPSLKVMLLDYKDYRHEAIARCDRVIEAINLHHCRTRVLLSS